MSEPLKERTRRGIAAGSRTKAQIANIAINSGDRNPWCESIDKTVNRLITKLGVPAPAEGTYPADWLIAWAREHRSDLLKTARQRRAAKARAVS